MWFIIRQTQILKLLDTNSLLGYIHFRPSPTHSVFGSSVKCSEQQLVYLSGRRPQETRGLLQPMQQKRNSHNTTPWWRCPNYSPSSRFKPFYFIWNPPAEDKFKEHRSHLALFYYSTKWLSYFVHVSNFQIVIRPAFIYYVFLLKRDVCLGEPLRHR